MSMNFNDFAEHLRTMAGQVGEDFDKPDDDWVPMAFFEGADGVVITPLTFDKSLWSEALTEIGQKVKARKLGMILSSWLVYPVEGEDFDSMPTPSVHPRRVESLLVQVIDAEVVRVWCAEIKRTVMAAPTLGEWQEWAERGGAVLGGELIDSLRGALR